MLLQCARYELSKHLQSKLWLVLGHHMTGISDNQLPQVLHRRQVPGWPAIEPVNGGLCLMVLVDGTPGCHGVEHLHDASVVADDVEVAVVDQNLQQKY